MGAPRSRARRPARRHRHHNGPVARGIPRRAVGLPGFGASRTWQPQVLTRRSVDTETLGAATSGRGERPGRLTMMDTMTASELIGGNGVRRVEFFELRRRTEVRDEHLRGGSSDRAPGGVRPDSRHGEHTGMPGRPVLAPPRGDPTPAEPRARGAAQPMASEPSTLEVYLPTEGRAGWLWGWPRGLPLAVP